MVIGQSNLAFVNRYRLYSDNNRAGSNMTVSRRAFGGALLGASGWFATDSSAWSAEKSPLLPQAGTVEWRRDGSGVDTKRPRFRWTLAAGAAARNKLQSAFRLRIVDLSARTIFNSGRVASGAMRYQPDGELTLLPQRRYDWYLTVWDEAGMPSRETHAGTFVTGLFDMAQDYAQWIAAQPQGAAYVQTTWANHPDTAPNPPLPIFRKDVALRSRPVCAIVSLAGLGQYQLFVNGRRVSPVGLNGAWTDYSKRVLYDTYDLTAFIDQGVNWLAVELGNGFFNVEGRADRYRKYVSRYGPPQLWLQLRLVHADGSETLVTSDETWWTREGATVFSHIYGGEDYDARAYIEGWREGKGPLDGWRKPEVLAGQAGIMHAHKMRPMKSFRRLDARLIGQPKPGVLVYDCGVNHSGRPVLVVKDLKAGARIVIHPGELLAADGSVDQTSMTRWAEHSHNIEYGFTSAGGAEETWEPAFTYNGYRYLQVEGAEPGQIVSLASDFLTDDFAQSAFQCGDERLNRVHGLIRQAVLSNAASYLTDCPDREKLGWLEQTYLNADTILMNLDAGALYEKIAGDMADAQLASGMVPSFAPEYLRFTDANEQDADLRNIPEWGAACVLAPWAAFRYYGDAGSLASSYPMMQKFAAYVLTRVRADGLVGYGIGDWYDFGPNPPGPAQLTSLAMTCTATLCHVFRSLSQITRVLALQGADAYQAQAERFKSAILSTLYDPTTHQFDKGSQTANAMALALDIVPEDARRAVLDKLIGDIRARRDHVTSGDVGFHYVVEALSKAGRGDVLYAMLKRDDKPSYGQQLANGATSLTEAWDSERVSSQNHFMLGHIESWFYRGLGGINVDLTRRAAAAIEVAPDWTCGVPAASVRYNSVFGVIGSDWSIDGRRWTMRAEIPHGAMAIFIPPSGKPQTIGSGTHTLSGLI